MTDEKGFYKLQTQQGAPDAGTVPGTYDVTISMKESYPTGKQVFDETENGMVDEYGSRQIVPKMYLDKKTSKLVATVEAKKKNVFNFDLEGKP